MIWRCEATTSGTWTGYFGSDVGLSDSSSKGVSGVWIDSVTGEIYLTTGVLLLLTAAVATERTFLFAFLVPWAGLRPAPLVLASIGTALPTALRVLSTVSLWFPTAARYAGTLDPRHAANITMGYVYDPAVNEETSDSISW